MNDSYIMGCYGCKYLNGEYCEGKELCLGHNNYTKNVEVKTMKKTFKEVIADIKEGEVWVEETGTRQLSKVYINEYRNISFEFMGVPTKDVTLFNGEETNYYDISVGTGQGLTFVLQRKKVSLAEAFKEYEEGKEIESCVDNCIFKKINGEDHYKFNSHNTFSVKCDEEDYWFNFEHIRGEWYINA